ncbi:putative nucleotide-binding alpha-beta plait domain superfamily, RNA-binding domain superfamily [Helianthus annuus]|nr:putative nucleotide-binding alpha-beta plait domain superfamily, RNA-binding domain superfamily [Helianthus annuus]
MLICFSDYCGLADLLHIYVKLECGFCKVKQSGQSKGYDFIEFVNRAAAERHLQAYNGTLMPNVEQLFRLNWASFGAGERKQDDIPDYTMTHPITLYLWGIWQLMLRAIPC